MMAGVLCARRFYRAIKMEPPNRVTRVLDRIFFEWLGVHMDLDCRIDAVMPNELLEYHPEHGLQLQPFSIERMEQFRHQRAPLHFQSMEMYEDRSYLVTLEKAPYAFCLHKLTVRNVPLSHESSTMIGNTNVEQVFLPLPYGNYLIRCEGAPNYEYLISLDVTRVSSPFNV